MADPMNTRSDSEMLAVLSLLREGDRYGFEITSLLEASEENPFRMREGSLYPLLHTLEQNHYVRSLLKETSDGKTRRHYRLTKSGASYLKKLEAGMSTSGGNQCDD